MRSILEEKEKEKKGLLKSDMSSIDMDNNQYNDASTPLQAALQSRRDKLQNKRLGPTLNDNDTTGA